jgi:hypothetical protein
MSGACTTTPGIVWSDDPINDSRLNQTANPVIQVNSEAITDRELQLAGLLTKLSGRLIQPNFFLNGNFDLPFWDEGLTSQSAPISTDTPVSRFWILNPGGAGLTYIADTTVPDSRAYYSVKVTGAPSVTQVDFGQNVPAWISRNIRTWVVISAYVLNNTGSTVTPQLIINTADVVDVFSAVTLRSTNNLQAVAASSSTWEQVYLAVDLSAVTNAANGFQFKFRVPSGVMVTTGKFWHFSECKIEIGVNSSSVPSGYVFDAFDANIQNKAAGGRVGYTTTALTNANQTLTCGTSKVNQDYTGTLSGAVTVNLSRTGAFEGARFRVNLNSLITSGANTLTFQENGSGSLVVFNSVATVRGLIEFVYTGSAWVIFNANVGEQ